MKRNSSTKGNKTVYMSDAKLWAAFIERAWIERKSVSSLLEKAMAEYLERCQLHCQENTT